MSESSKKMIFGSAMILFLLSLVNKGLGFIKSMVIASVFGANLQTDAYYVAEGLMQNALIPVSDALAVSFLPVYIGIREKRRQEAEIFTSRTLADIFLLSFVISALLYMAAPQLLMLILPSYSPEEVALSVSYFRILIWGMCFYMSNQLLQSLLNAEKEYGYASFTSMFNNLILTAAVCCLGKWFGLKAMASAVLFSYTVQYLFLQTKSWRYGHPSVRHGLRDERVRDLCRQVFPVFLGNAIWEVNNLVDKILLSAMDEGAVTAVSYAVVLYQFASNLIGIPLTTIIYTELAESFSEGRMRAGGEKLEKGIHISLFFCVPISLFVVTTAGLIVQITYGRGAFSAEAVRMTTDGLRFYAPCLLAYCVNLLMARACYSLNDMALPMKVGIGTVSLNIVLSVILSRFMGLRGVVLATVIANTLTGTGILVIFHRTKLKLHLGKFIRPTVRIVCSAALATAVCALWLHAGPAESGLLLFVGAACLEFGVYAALTLLCREELGLELAVLVRTALRAALKRICRKKAERE